MLGAQRVVWEELPGTRAEVGRAPGPECVSEHAHGHTQGRTLCPQHLVTPPNRCRSAAHGTSGQIQTSVSCFPITRALPGVPGHVFRSLQSISLEVTPGDTEAKGKGLSEVPG